MKNKNMRSFRCEPWMYDGINEAAEEKGLSYSEWIRKTLSDALGEAGFTQASWYRRRENKDK